MGKEETYKRPLAEHEVKRSSLLTATLVILIAIVVPILLIPEEEEEAIAVEKIEAPIAEQIVPPVDKLDAFGDYKRKDPGAFYDGWLDAIKHFVLNYTVYGQIYRNVDKEKVADSFRDLHEGAKPLYEKSKQQNDPKRE